ncbi:MAG: DUF2997 domain-containing protein [Caldilineaceae bacterium]|nr:DUF2997 domain-containing protein [Caldilineaceae bacterium]
MQSQEIEVTIHPDGKVEYTIKGVKGSACEDISALLEKLGQVEEEERTGEFYERDGDTQIHIG